MINPIFKEKLEARLLMWHIAAFCIGIILGQFFLLSALPVMLLLGVTLFISFWAWHYKFPYALLLLAFVVGFSWSEVQGEKINGLQGREGEIVSFVGEVVSSPAKMSKGYKFYVKGYVTEENQITDYNRYQVLVYGDDTAKNLSYGDKVKIDGKIVAGQYFANPGSFNYNTYLLSQEVSATLDTRYQGNLIITQTKTGWSFMALAAATKDKVYEAIEHVPEDSRSFLQGIIFGDKSSLDSMEKTMLSAVGIFHAFAVSGLHVGFVAIFMVAIANFLRLKPWGKLLFVTVGLLFYGAMANFTPSVTRAIIMSIMIYLAYAIGTSRDSYTALAVAAAIILILSPSAVTTAGFQLSFVATWGILYLTNFFQQLLPLPAGKIKSSLAVTLAAQFATMPLIAYYYSMLTVGGIILSPLVIPLIGVVVILGVISCAFSFLSVTLAAIPLYSAGLIAEFVQFLSELFLKLPFSYFVVGRPPIWLIFLFYLLLVMLPYLGKQKSFLVKEGTGELLDGLLHKKKENKDDMPAGNQNPTLKVPGYCYVIVCLLVLLLFFPNMHFQNNLEIVILDVGQGSSAFITTPQGKHILVDGGVNVVGDDYAAEQAVFPYLQQRGITTLDAVINTHPHNDHTAAIKTVFQLLEVKHFLTAPVFPEVEEQQLLLSLAEINQIPVSFVQQGKRITLEPGIVMEVFYPKEDALYWEEEANDGSLVLKLTYGEFDMLLTGDSEQAALEDIVSFPLESEILLLPHHGSKSSLNLEFYRQVSPEVVIASAGRGNKFGHPSIDVVNYWQEQQIPFYRTDQNGAITITTDGNTYEVKTFITEK